MEPDWIVLPSAFRHGVAPEDVDHALAYAALRFAQDDDMTMIVGPARNGRWLEVGYIDSAEGPIVVVHAMDARRKYLEP